MKKVSVQDAVGIALCHDITAVQNGIKGSIFKRGYIISNTRIFQNFWILASGLYLFGKKTQVKFTRKTAPKDWLQ